MKAKLVLSVFFSLTVFAVYAIDTNGEGNPAKTEAPTGATNTKHQQTTKIPQVTKGKTDSPVESTTKAENMTTTVNVTMSEQDKSFYKHIMDNKDMLMRTFYVLLAVTSIVLLYFGIKAWRMKRRRSKSRKYGLISTRGSDLEMEPLDGNDDDDDMTVFEVNGHHR